MVSTDVSLEIEILTPIGAVGTLLAVLSLAFMLLLEVVLGELLTIIIVGIS